MSSDTTATIETEFPSVEELQAAIEIVKDPPHNLKSTAIKHTDLGAGLVRHYLPDKFHTWPLDEVRMACESLSKAGKEPGREKRTDAQRQASTLRQLIALFPPEANHSKEYDDIHRSLEYRQLRDARKRALDFMCQGCCRHFLGSELEGHILNYEEWGRPGRMLILCRLECHPLFDSLRRRGIQSERDGTKLDLLF